MTALTDLSDEIEAQLIILVADETIIDLTNQRDDDGAVNPTFLTATANHGARAVQRLLGRTVDNTDNDAVDFGVRMALLRMASLFSLTLSDDGLAYTAGVLSELKEERRARQQSIQSIELSLEDFVEEDLRWPEERWDESVNSSNT